MSTETFYINVNSENDREVRFVHLLMQQKREWKTGFEKHFRTQMELQPASGEEGAKIMFICDSEHEQKVRNGYNMLLGAHNQKIVIDEELLGTLAAKAFLNAPAPANNNNRSEAAPIRMDFNNSVKSNKGWGDKKPGKGASNGKAKKPYFFSPRTEAQKELVQKLRDNDVTFGVGPAGTGKTHVAVAMAIEALKEGKIERIFLARPAMPSGKDLGALPGGLEEKLAPYMRPLYDELATVLGDNAKLTELMEGGIIEIAPVEMMRGRTFKNAYVIVDEAQNCDQGQMRMALTRLGEGSKMAITGDPGQVDLKDKSTSGLVWALDRLQNVEGVGIQTFTANDVVRHPVVARIVTALDDNKPASAPAPSAAPARQPVTKRIVPSG